LKSKPYITLVESEELQLIPTVLPRLLRDLT
jgi:hypothetical protein